MSENPYSEEERETGTKVNDFGKVERPETNNYIYNKILDRIHEKNKNYILVVCGETGSGKTYAATRMAEQLDPTFNADRIKFPPIKDLTDTMLEKKKNGELKQGMFWVLDEGGIAQSNRRWYSDANVYFNFILQSFRKWAQGVITTLPHLNLLDPQSRQFRNAFARMEARGRVIYYNSYQIEKNGEVYDCYYRKDGEKIKKIDLPMPQRIDMEEYEKRKDNFIEDIMQDKIKEAGKSRKERLNEIKGKVLENIEDYKTRQGLSTQLIRVENEISRDDAEYVHDKIMKEENK